MKRTRWWEYSLGGLLSLCFIFTGIDCAFGTTVRDSGIVKKRHHRPERVTYETVTDQDGNKREKRKRHEAEYELTVLTDSHGSMWFKTDQWSYRRAPMGARVKLRWRQGRWSKHSYSVKVE